MNKQLFVAYVFESEEVKNFFFFIMVGEVIGFFFFFFQAEDGIRDFHVTGVQTCALPICTNIGHYLTVSFRSHQLSRVWYGEIGRPGFLVSQENKPLFTKIVIDNQRITLMHLCSRQQPGNWVHQITLNGALQVAGSIALVGSLFQEELPAFACDSKQERPRRRVQHALLHLPEFDLQHLVQFLALQWMEHHYLVQSIHELWRELPPRRFHRGPLHFLVQSRYGLVLRLDEPHTPLHQFSDLAASQVGGQEDHGL